MVAEILKVMAQVAALNISLSGEVVGQAQRIEANEEQGSVTLHELALTGDHLRTWTSGAEAPAEATLVGMDGRGQVVLELPLTEARVRGYLHARQQGEQRLYDQLTVVEPKAPAEGEEEAD